jgi:hypothetical protein
VCPELWTTDKCVPHRNIYITWETCHKFQAPKVISGPLSWPCLLFIVLNSSTKIISDVFVQVIIFSKLEHPKDLQTRSAVSELISWKCFWFKGLWNQIY